MRKTLSDKGVAALKPRPARYAEPDPELRGHWVRVQPSGSKSFVAVTRDHSGKQIWTTIGPTDVFTIEEARERAREIIKRVHSGLPANVPKTENFGDVIASWLKRHVDSNGLRSKDKILGLIERHIDADFRAREFTSIRRTDVIMLLDQIEDDHGGRQADYVLAIIRAVMNWYATRHDDYVPPLVKGMQRTNAKERARSRILNDDELRRVWKAAEQCGAFGALVRLLLYTAQRHSKVAAMKWADVSAKGVWMIATKAREKGNAGALQLPPLALDIIRSQPVLGDNPYVFAGRGNGHSAGTSKAKARLDKLARVQGWVLHDLRRTARSLMSRAGVSGEHAERVMGHSPGGVEDIYNHHDYADEKAEALARLAGLIAKIVCTSALEQFVDDKPALVV